MYQRLLDLFNQWQVPMADWAALGAVLAIIIIIATLTYYVMQRIVLRSLDHLAKRSQTLWQRALFGRKLFSRSVIIIQLVLLNWQVELWLPDSFFLHAPLSVLFDCLIVFYGMLALYSLLDVTFDYANASRAGRELPLRGLFQGIKLTLAVMAVLLLVSILIGQSPTILLSGLGAMTAILLLVFKDPILGLVAGIQLSANRMVAIGDWVEMKKYQADGDVIDITLTTVKVQNWDKTITTIPTYAMISDAFVNWQGMQNAGARRIKRSLLIDVNSVQFLNDDQQAEMKELEGVSDYFATQERPTNIGALRAYISAILIAHDDLRKDMTTMVRQLQPTQTGIPLEIYCFSKVTDWVAYEAIQADIFDQLYATISAFELRLYQAPNGNDFQRLVS